jgi:hypothetical protein
VTWVPWVGKILAPLLIILEFLDTSGRVTWFRIYNAFFSGPRPGRRDTRFPVILIFFGSEFAGIVVNAALCDLGGFSLVIWFYDWWELPVYCGWRRFFFGGRCRLARIVVLRHFSPGEYLAILGSGRLWRVAEAFVVLNTKIVLLVHFCYKKYNQNAALPNYAKYFTGIFKKKSIIPIFTHTNKLKIQNNERS